MRAETPISGRPRDTKYSKIAKKGCFGLFLEKMALMYDTLFGLIHLNVFSGVLAFLTGLLEILEALNNPHSITEARWQLDWPEWEKAIKEEKACLKEFRTYTPIVTH